MNTSASSHDAILSALNWRYACKKFDATKKIADADWKVLTASLVLTPSSYGIQAWKFLVVQDPEIRGQLKAVSWGQTQVTDASHYVVLTTPEKISEADIKAYIDRIVELRGATPESLKGYHDVLIKNVVNGMSAEKTLPWTQKQAYIAMGFLLETAALLKIDSTPMEGFDPVAYDKILKLEDTGWKSAASVALGYRHVDDEIQHAKKVRFAENHIVKYI